MNDDLVLIETQRGGVAGYIKSMEKISVLALTCLYETAPMFT